MDIGILSVKCIGRKGLTHCLFQQFLECIETRYVDVSYLVVRCLSRSAVLKRFYLFTIWNKHFQERKVLNCTRVIRSSIDNIARFSSGLNMLMSLTWNFKENISYCMMCFLLLNHLKWYCNCWVNILANEIWNTTLFWKISLEYLSKPSECLVLKNKFVSMIQQLLNYFSSKFTDLYTSSNEIRLFWNHSAIDINEVSAQMQMEVTELQSTDSLKDAFSVWNLLQFYSRLRVLNFSTVKTFAKKRTLHLIALTYVNKRCRLWSIRKINIVPGWLMNTPMLRYEIFFPLLKQILTNKSATSNIRNLTRLILKLTLLNYKFEYYVLIFFCKSTFKFQICFMFSLKIWLLIVYAKINCWNCSNFK